ncbi:MAG: DUF445 family protein [Peptostreptococcales bacterium]
MEEMYIIKLISLGVVGGIIGYVTNAIAVKMIFRPLKPKKILGLTLQGLIPKRRLEISKVIGEVVDSELVSVESIIDKIIEEGYKEQIIEEIKIKVMNAIEKNMPSLVQVMFGGVISDFVEDMIDKEADHMVTEMLQGFIDNGTARIEVSKMVEEKINSFELEKMEEIILKIAKKELKYIELLGGVIGFAIGIVQGLIILNL